LFRPLFLSPHSPPSRRWVYISEPTNLNLYRRSGHFTCQGSTPLLTLDEELRRTLEIVNLFITHVADEKIPKSKTTPVIHTRH
jgi:hypothetical protein